MSIQEGGQNATAEPPRTADQVRRSRFYAHLCAVEGLMTRSHSCGSSGCIPKPAHHCGCGGVEVFKITARSVDRTCAPRSPPGMV